MKYLKINSRESDVNSIHTDEKAYRRWKKWMEIGSKTGCHQLADRSFFLKGYQMPVCARCTGVLIGYLIAIPGFFLAGFSAKIAGAGMTVLFTDWLLQAAGIKKSTNKRRVATGILGGYGVMSFQLFLLQKIGKFIFKKK
jgi:uncharacterized membrane protein